MLNNIRRHFKNLSNCNVRNVYLIRHQIMFDSEHNCFTWMEQNVAR